MAAKLERLREAERALLELAFPSSERRPTLQSLDTPIPVSSIHPDQQAHCLVGSTVQKDDQKCYVIHSISVTSAPDNVGTSETPPLVLLHGYSMYILCYGAVIHGTSFNRLLHFMLFSQ